MHAPQALLRPAWLTERPFAHRGLHGPGAPENTLAAFERALAADYPVELDVQMLGDGELVVFHDHDLVRAAGVERALRQEDRRSIRQYGLFGTDERIPTLRAALALLSGRVPLLIEIKNRPARPGIEQAVLGTLAAYRGPFAVQSFNPSTVAWFRRHAPALPRGQLAGALRYAGISALERLASRSLSVCAWSRPSFLNYELRALPDAWVEGIARRCRLPLLAWTVRTEADRDKATALGVNYVFDDVRP